MPDYRVIMPNSSKSNDLGISCEINPFRADSVGVYYRRAGSVSGKHYHTGSLPTTNPERHILVKGQAILRTKNLETGEVGSVVLVAPCLWEVEPQVYHELEAVEDIIFIEPRLAGYDPDSDKIKMRL